MLVMSYTNGLLTLLPPNAMLGPPKCLATTSLRAYTGHPIYTSPHRTFLPRTPYTPACTYDALYERRNALCSLSKLTCCKFATGALPFRTLAVDALNATTWSSTIRICSCLQMVVQCRRLLSKKTAQGSAQLIHGNPFLRCEGCSYVCSYCGQSISNEAIVTGDESYHADCFRCKACSTRIEELVFAKTSQGIYW